MQQLRPNNIFATCTARAFLKRYAAWRAKEVLFLGHAAGGTQTRKALSAGLESGIESLLIKFGAAGLCAARGDAVGRSESISASSLSFINSDAVAAPPEQVLRAFRSERPPAALF
jgi:hypothetical protein